LQAAEDFTSAVRASLAAGAPPPVMLETGHCARVDRCATFGVAVLFDKWIAVQSGGEVPFWFPLGT